MSAVTIEAPPPPAGPVAPVSPLTPCGPRRPGCSGARLPLAAQSRRSDPSAQSDPGPRHRALRSPLTPCGQPDPAGPEPCSPRPPDPSLRCRPWCARRTLHPRRTLRPYIVNNLNQPVVRNRYVHRRQGRRQDNVYRNNRLADRDLYRLRHPSRTDIDAMAASTADITNQATSRRRHRHVSRHTRPTRNHRPERRRSRTSPANPTHPHSAADPRCQPPPRTMSIWFGNTTLHAKATTTLPPGALRTCAAATAPVKSAGNVFASSAHNTNRHRPVSPR